MNHINGSEKLGGVKNNRFAGIKTTGKNPMQARFREANSVRKDRLRLSRQPVFSTQRNELCSKEKQPDD
jgi:hypothetical protein